MGRLATGGIEPDLTIVLDLPNDVAVTRRKTDADRMERRGDDFHARVRAGFRAEAQFRPGQVKVVDASRPIEVVHREICHALESAHLV